MRCRFWALRFENNPSGFAASNEQKPVLPDNGAGRGSLRLFSTCETDPAKPA
jgi:hypothetical protein